MAPEAGAGHPLRGIGLIVAAVALITLNDAVIKGVSESMPVGQIMALRGTVMAIPVALVVWRSGGLASLRIHSLRDHFTRGALSVAATFAFMTALHLLPLADAVAVMLASPLFLTALAGPMLGEPVGWRRWTAVFVGFLGVLLIVRPTGAGLHWVALIPLAAALIEAVRDALTRRMSRRESSASVLATTTAAVALGGYATLFWGWVWPTALQGLLILASALMLGLAHYLVIESFRLAEAALIAPFKYTNMLWAVLFGLLFFGHLPEAPTLAGAAIVIASGLYILYRETRRRRTRLR